MQVTSAASPAGPWAPFQLIAFQGRYNWCMASKHNVYSSAVKTNPADDSTLLGVFPFTGPGTGLNSGERPRKYYAHIAVAVSCDGVHFSEPLPVLKVSRDWWGRPNDLPVDGYVVRGDSVLMFVHEVSRIDGRRATPRHHRNPLPRIGTYVAATDELYTPPHHHYHIPFRTCPSRMTGPTRLGVTLGS